MDTRLIVAAIIRIWSLQQFYEALAKLINIPVLLDLISKTAGPSKEALWKNLTIQCVYICIVAFVGIILWHFAPPISSFIIKKLEKSSNA